jgi:hypothetical protein
MYAPATVLQATARQSPEMTHFDTVDDGMSCVAACSRYDVAVAAAAVVGGGGGCAAAAAIREARMKGGGSAKLP